MGMPARISSLYGGVEAPDVHRISRTRIHGLPLDLEGWKFGLDLAATHVFGWSPSADPIPLWMMSFSNHSEGLSTLSRAELLPGGTWLGPHTVQSLFGRLGLVQSTNSKFEAGVFLFVIMEESYVWLQQIDGDHKMQGCRIDRFTLSTCQEDFHPIVLYSPASSMSWSWSPTKRWSSRARKIMWYGPLTQSKRDYSRHAVPSYFEEKNWHGFDHLVSPGGQTGVIFHSYSSWPVELKGCLGLTRFGGVICRSASPAEFLLANYDQEGGLEKTTVVLPPGGPDEEVLLAMEDAWGRLNFITRFEGSLYLTEWRP